MDWFHDKLCLDIGCNNGNLTMKIAENFGPKHIIGIDVDHVLIDSAQSLLKITKYSVKDKSAKVTPILFVPRSLPAGKPALKNEPYPFNVSFACKDLFQLESKVDSEGKYDTILCLSLVKWVHLNMGDDGLYEFFRKLYSLLHVDGLVVFEYQPWKSYVNNKSKSDRIKEVFPTIQIRPEDFERILCDEIGFAIEQRLGTPLEDAKGFDRPILLLRRPDKEIGNVPHTATSQLRESRDAAHTDEPVACKPSRKEEASSGRKKRKRDDAHQG